MNSNRKKENGTEKKVFKSSQIKGYSTSYESGIVYTVPNYPM